MAHDDRPRLRHMIDAINDIRAITNGRTLLDLEVAGIGNVLRHDYANIAPRLLWAIIWEHLPDLEAVCVAEAAQEQT